MFIVAEYSFNKGKEYILKSKGIVMKILLLSFLTLVGISPLGADGEKIPSPVVRVGAQLFSDGDQNLLAINFSNHPHWHTYWKNPGDSGRPIRVNLAGVRLTPLEWPSPQRFVEPGNIVVYGYNGDYTLFFKMDPVDYREKQNQPLNLSIQWLVCKHICLPEKIGIAVTFENGGLSASGTTLGNLPEATLRSRKGQLPGPMDYPQGMELSLVREGDGLSLHYKVGKGRPAHSNKNRNILTPLPHKLATFKHEKLFVDELGQVYGKMDLDWDGEYSQPSVPLPEDGRFVQTLTLSFLHTDPYSGKTGIIRKSFEGFSSVGSVKLRRPFPRQSRPTRFPSPHL